ncbi:XAP5-domain-containing protein [Coemansia reversa NRRL 1564]|uniref:XAP5-domain-containing protein n=1 Tax=Coemansia reversa (strain ATCC 12441 / NRRL 1564) TaxID=763665 RepID=A0A2G5B803_COERN|nr:XAP5-domain-containing protein [Coemansia reversa NRRL 1564]|eukprot:PIA15148.1 XAP5-domain-containing protein [Coemansia reversa NRRL 1564]
MAEDHEDQRVEYLRRQREKMRAELEQKRGTATTKAATTANKAIGRQTSSRQRNDFVIKEESVENKLKLSTIGLVKLEEFQRIKGELEEERQRAAAKTLAVHNGTIQKNKKPKRTTVAGQKSILSFDEDDEVVLVKKARKNPTVDTSFLPDKDREEEEARLREELRRKWLCDQESVKKEPITVTYSYWDGSGHRKQARCVKGDTIAQFLEKCKAQVPELRASSVDSLVYVKEDLIIPHHYTFYDFIINKARGKSGPLFSFDVHDDVRLTQDVRIEKDDSHAGKVCERSWYERNKHIFPANRWEIFDPEKNYGSYTIRDSRKPKFK